MRNEEFSKTYVRYSQKWRLLHTAHLSTVFQVKFHVCMFYSTEIAFGKLVYPMPKKYFSNVSINEIVRIVRIPYIL